MSVPKVIYQTFKSHKLPLIEQWPIWGFRKRNSEYQHEFYDNDIFNFHYQLNIGAAKADFFKYAIPYEKGGVYLDIGSAINGRLNSFRKKQQLTQPILKQPI